MAKKELSENDKLLIEAHKINYRLRSTFFYRKLHEYKTLEFPSVIKSLIPHSNEYNWDNFADWGISNDALQKIKESELELIQVFTHPRLLREHPRLVAYYRNVAALSQKATKYLSGCMPDRFEAVDNLNMPEETSFKLSKLFNEHISLIVESAFANFREDELHGVLFASTGAQIDGSWRNSIGEEAEKVVQAMIAQEAVKRGILSAFIMREKGKVVEPTSDVIEYVIKNIREIKGLMLSNQKSILFSSEPDLTFLNKDGKSELVIEVKGGTDPAGALERYGASKKSFQHERGANANVLTCLIASCITNEVETRIATDQDFNKYFNLTQILTDDTKKEEVLTYLFDQLER